MAQSATKALASFAASLSYEHIPAATAHIVKRIILDSIGTALAATSLGEGCREVVAFAQRLGGAAESTILGIGAKVASPHAAFANGALVHALNYDPIGAHIGHIGVACLPAPLALAEARGGVSGKELIAAAAVSCEVTARVTAAISRTGRRPSERFLSGQLLTHFGAAAGAARILELPIHAMESAFGLALMQMSGSRQIVLSGDPSAKAIYGAFPNQAGVTSALLAREGLDAACDVFGPPAGLYAAIYGDVHDAASLQEGLGEAFLLDEAEFKPWPASNQVHAFIEAAMRLAHGLDASDIAAVEVVCHSRLRPWCEPSEKRRRPENAAAAADSIPFCIASALVDANVTLTTFTDEALNNQRVLAIAQCLRILFNDSVAGARVSVETNNGHRATAQVETPLGSQQRPISDDQLQSKFRDCCLLSSTMLRRDQVDRLIDLVFNLHELQDVATLTALTCGRGLI